MLNIYPKFGSYQSYPLKNDNKSLNKQGFIRKGSISLHHQSSALNIAFKGTSPESHLRYMVKKLVTIVKSEKVQKIAWLTHKRPDGDAYGSIISGSNIIKTTTGKHVDMFVMDALPKNFTCLDPDNEIKVINNILQTSTDSSLPITPEQIKEKFGDYDLVIISDAPSIGRIDGALEKGILANSKMVAIIDHHIAMEDFGKKGVKPAIVNIIDTTKESACQIIMQLVKPFGLDPKKLSPKISDALSAGIVTDSSQFEFAKGKGIFKDTAILKDTSNIHKIIEEVNTIERYEFKDLINILNNVKYSEDGEIAYFILDKETNAKDIALLQISRIRGIKYYFCITKNLSEPNEVYCSMRSKDKPINKIANELGGGGHELFCGFTTEGKTTEEVAKIVLEKLTTLKNS